MWKEIDTQKQEKSLTSKYGAKVMVRQRDDEITVFFDTKRIGGTMDTPSSYKMDPSYIEAGKIFRDWYTRSIGRRNLKKVTILEEGKTKSGVAAWVGSVYLKPIDENNNRERSEEIIEITEDVKVPGTDIILEAGDRVKVLDEMNMPEEDQFLDAARNYFNKKGEFFQREGADFTRMYAGKLAKYIVQSYRLSKMYDKDNRDEFLKGIQDGMKTL